MLGMVVTTLIGGVAIAGCSKKVVAPPATMNQSTADDFAVQTVASLELLGGDVAVAVGSTPPSANVSPRVAPMRAQWDTSFTQNGLTYEASRTFYDALDIALPGWTPTAVRLHWTSRAYGTVEWPRDTATVGHASVLDVRGIQAGTDTLVFGGTCLDTLLNHFQSLDGLRIRDFYWQSSLSIAAVRILKSTLQTSAAPIAGTLTLQASADRLRSNNRNDVEAHFDVTVVVVFHPNGEADVTINGTYRYLWEVDTGFIVRA
jgi:hypothetical protein